MPDVLDIARMFLSDTCVAMIVVLGIFILGLVIHATDTAADTLNVTLYYEYRDRLATTTIIFIGLVIGLPLSIIYWVTPLANARRRVAE